MLNNINYEIPKDPKKIMMDFYFLSYVYGKKLENNSNIEFQINEICEEFFSFIKDHLLHILEIVLFGEFRYVFTSEYYPNKEYFIHNFEKYSDFLKPYIVTMINLYAKDDASMFVNSYFKYKNYIYNYDHPAEYFYNMGNIQLGQRKNSYQAFFKTLKKVKYSKEKIICMLEDFFYTPHRLKDAYWCQSYGGKKYLRITEALSKLYKANTIHQIIIYADHVYDLQHNCDTIFDKIDSYQKISPFDESGYEWIKVYLDIKKNIKHILEFYPFVSNSLKSLVAFLSKNYYSMTMEDAMTRFKNRDKIFD